MYRRAPSLFQAPFRAAEKPVMMRNIKRLFTRKYSDKLHAFIQQEQPDFLINTFWMYQGVLENVAIDTPRKLLNVLADPITVHPLTIAAPPFLNAGYTNETITICKTFAPDGVYEPFGWFVRSEFEESYNQKVVQAKLGINPEHFTVLMNTGSQGTQTILDILELLQTTIPVEIIVACGTNDALNEKVQSLAETKKKMFPQMRIQALAFTNKMYEYMQAADVVIGKAGPNSLFESVATHTPFFATTHIAGQEDGNLELIKKEKFGFVEEDSEKAVALLERIIAKPAMLEEFAAPIKKAATYNKAAGEKLKKHLTEYFAARS